VPEGSWLGRAVGSWHWVESQRQPVRVISKDSVWGHEWVTVHVPASGSLLKISPTELRPLLNRKWTSLELRARSLALIAMEGLEQAQVMTLPRVDIDPLPHQISAVEYALSRSPTRLLLADDVGLGKTIEAGLILKELKLRSQVKRTLVVAPKSMQLQWVREMNDRFGERFVRIGAGGIPIEPEADVWNAFDQVVCAIDGVKPVTDRQGWTQERTSLYNRGRFEGVTNARWDLVIIDEAHHVAGSDDDVARHLLAKELCRRADRVLLLSATPHSGKTESFARLMGLLDQDFEIGKPITSATIRPYVVRTDKRAARSADGKPLFLPRTTALARVPYGGRAVEKQLYDAVTDYVRHGYQRALLEKNNAVGFLTLLMQRLVSSSTAAILSALEKRLLAIGQMGDQLQLFPGGSEDWGDLSGEEQVQALEEARQKAWGDEFKEVEILIDLARRASGTGPDAKAGYLLSLIQQVRREAGDPSLKILLFTEFRETQEMLISVLNEAGFSTSKINGDSTIEAREVAQREFRTSKEVLVSTDAGGEGINLQFAHVVINYDMPWNPMKVEQRIGRVDRIGQAKPVKAFNLITEHSVDDRVLSVLEAKLETILAEMGLDKRSEILETAASGIESLYAAALVNPEVTETRAQELVAKTRRAVSDAASSIELPSMGPVAARAQVTSPEASEQAARAWFEWSGQPVGSIGELVGRLPIVARGEPVPRVKGPEPGVLTAWELTVGRSHRIFYLFRTDAGSMRPDLAIATMGLCARFQGALEQILLSDDHWDRIQELGGIYTPQPRSDDEIEAAPSLDLRLVVAVGP